MSAAVPDFSGNGKGRKLANREIGGRLAESRGLRAEKPGKSIWAASGTRSANLQKKYEMRKEFRRFLRGRAGLPAAGSEVDLVFR
jgi:hypothetical protein